MMISLNRYSPHVSAPLCHRLRFKVTWRRSVGAYMSLEYWPRFRCCECSANPSILSRNLQYGSIDPSAIQRSPVCEQGYSARSQLPSYRANTTTSSGHREEVSITMPLRITCSVYRLADA